MDALRKAEEAKKQAEQAEAPEQGQEQVEQKAAAQQPATPPIQEPPEIEAPAQPDSSLSESETTAGIDDSASDAVEHTVPPIPDVEIEFQQEQEEDGNDEEESKLEEAAEEESVQESAEESVEESEESINESKEESEPSEEPMGLSLEPIDAGLSSVTRKDFDVDAAPDYSLETPKPIVNSQYNAPGKSESDTKAATKEESGIHYGAEPQYQPPVVEPNPETRPAESAKGSAAEPQPVRPAPPTNQVRSRAVPNPSLRSEPDPDSISARSEPARRSAKAVFAAKKQGKKTRRFRIRRSTRIWAAQIAAALLLMAGGAYYYFATSGNSNTFNVPEQYLSNQDSYSNNFNDELAALDEAETNDEIAPETLAGLLEEAPPSVDLVDQVPEETSATDLIAEQVAADDPTAISEVIEPAEDPVEPIAITAEAQAVPEESDAAAVAINPSSSIASNNGSAQAVNSVQTFQPTRPVQPADGSISFSRAQASTGADPVLQDAYAAYQRDELSRAQELYQQVLIQSPLQRDALLGLAAIATRNNETSLAMELYSRLLARDPSDGVARAGLLGLRPLGGPEAQERELRRLQEEHPQVAPVAYALGNFYAVQNRWNEAQRFYFNALQLAKTDALAGVPVNPDYAFNLAVSLERLNQSAAAETYYREAIAFAEDFPAGFDVSVARSRLRSITGANS